METKITYYRNKISLTQEELARIVGVTRQTIISLEQNRYNPSLLLAYKITKALGQKNIEAVFVL
jgi:putative transcriptional regulator